MLNNHAIAVSVSAEDTQIVRIGRAVFAERRTRPAPFSWPERRLNEMLQLLHHRHGEVLPEVDDERDPYVFAVVATVFAWLDQPADRDGWLVGWLSAVAPWIEDPADRAEDLLAQMHPRRKHLSARAIGNLWRVTSEEVKGLKLRTIQPFDVGPVALRKKRADAKRERDRVGDCGFRRSRPVIPT